MEFKGKARMYRVCIEGLYTTIDVNTIYRILCIHYMQINNEQYSFEIPKNYCGHC